MLPNTIEPKDNSGFADTIVKTKWDWRFTFSTSYPITIYTCRSLMEKYFEVLRPHQATLFWVSIPVNDKYGIQIHGFIKTEKQILVLMVNGTSYFKKVWQNIADKNITGELQRAMVNRYDPADGKLEFLIQALDFKSNNNALLK